MRSSGEILASFGGLLMRPNQGLNPAVRLASETVKVEMVRVENLWSLDSDSNLLGYAAFQIGHATAAVETFAAPEATLAVDADRQASHSYGRY
jgi:hypothetical protein